MLYLHGARDNMDKYVSILPPNSDEFSVCGGLQSVAVTRRFICYRSMASTLYPLASLSQIEKTPSNEDGIPRDLEEDLRAYGCKLIHQAGILLKQYDLSGGILFKTMTVIEKKTGGSSSRANTFPTILVRDFYEAIWRRRKFWL